MNKKEFIEELSKELNYSEDKCNIVNEILEKNFFISKKSKDSIINELTHQLGIESKEANYIYDIAVKIIKEEVKNKLKHPFKNQN